MGRWTSRCRPTPTPADRTRPRWPRRHRGRWWRSRCCPLGGHRLVHRDDAAAGSRRRQTHLHASPGGLAAEPVHGLPACSPMHAQVTCHRWTRRRPCGRPGPRSRRGAGEHIGSDELGQLGPARRSDVGPGPAASQAESPRGRVRQRRSARRSPVRLHRHLHGSSSFPFSQLVAHRQQFGAADQRQGVAVARATPPPTAGAVVHEEARTTRADHHHRGPEHGQAGASRCVIRTPTGPPQSPPRDPTLGRFIDGGTEAGDVIGLEGAEFGLVGIRRARSPARRGG